MVKIRQISVYFNHFWSLCDGQHCSVGLLWEIWIEPSLSNTSMLLVWPENHFGVVYPEKMMRIWTISVYFDHFWSLCNWQHCSVGLLWRIWIEPSLPNTSMLSVWPENHFGVVYLGKMVQIWTISVHFSIIYNVHATGNTAQLDFWGDMNWVMSIQHPYAIGSTWEPLWSDISWEDGESSSDFGPSWSSSKFMLRTTLLSWVSVEVIDYVEFPQHPLAIGLTWEPHLSRMSWEKMMKVRGKIRNINSQTCIFSDLCFVLFFRPNFHFWTCIFSNVYFFLTIEVRRKNKFGKKYKSKKIHLQVWDEFWSLKKKMKVPQKNVSL